MIGRKRPVENTTVIEPTQVQLSDDEESSAIEEGSTTSADELHVTPEGPDQRELKFTGYTPPEKRGIGSFVMRHKLPVLGGLMMFAAVAGVGGILLASSGDEPVAQVVKESVTAVEEPEPAEVTPDEIEEKAHISDAQFSVENTGQFYSLETLDGEQWLDRSQYDWENYAEYEGWLFFTALKPAEDPEHTTIGLQVFNYETQKYAHIANMKLLESGRLVEPLYIENGYLYARVESGPRTDDAQQKDATYRCLLDLAGACTGFEEYYDGPGRVYTFSDDTKYIVDTTGLATTMEFETVSLFSVADETLTEVAASERSGGEGSYFERVDREEFVWLSEVAVSDGEQSSLPTVTRLYAVTTDGEIAFVIPGNTIPIARPERVFSPDLEYNQILYANAEQEVVFNTDTKQFEAPRERLLADDAQKQETLLDAEVRLNVPKEYLMRIVE